MPKMSSSEFQSHSTKIEDFKINPINLFNPISTKGGSENLSLFLGMSYNMPKMLCSQFQSYSIKIEDFKINPLNPFNPTSTKGGGDIFKSITANVLYYAQDVKFQILDL